MDLEDILEGIGKIFVIIVLVLLIVLAIALMAYCFLGWIFVIMTFVLG